MGSLLRGALSVHKNDPGTGDVAGTVESVLSGWAWRWIRRRRNPQSTTEYKGSCSTTSFGTRVRECWLSMRSISIRYAPLVEGLESIETIVLVGWL